MRIMGLDLGEKTIGVALSDPMGMIARGVEVIKRKTMEEDVKYLFALLQEYEVEKIVLGLPLNMNNTEGPGAKMARDFGRKLTFETGVPVVFWDERLTTVAAEKILLEADMSRAKRKKVIDKMAAVFILQNYLDKESR